MTIHDAPDLRGYGDSPVTPGTVIEFEVPDMYGRPWAKNWEKYYEPGMKDPDKGNDDELFNFDDAPAAPAGRK